MKKVIKLTSGILACTLVLSNFNSLDITKANEAPSITVSAENSNISAQIQTMGEKSYLVVKAIEDVNNIAVRVKVSNNQTFVFKHSELSKGEVVHFELDIADKKQEVVNKKTLPKTDIVREKLEVKGVVKGFSVVAIVSYDVEKEEIVKVETNTEESKVSENTELVTENKPTAEDVSEPVIAEEAKKLEDIQSDAWEKAATEANKEKELENKTNIEESKVSEVSKSAEEVKEEIKPKVEVKPSEIAKKIEEAQSDAWEKAATINNGTNVNLSNNETDSDKLVELLNKHRVANGKKPLEVDNNLSEGTLLRANEFSILAIKGKSGNDLHKRLDGSNFYTAFPKAIRGKLGENVSYGTRLESLMKFWKNSPAHNNNMLSDNYTKVSIKVVKQNGMYYGVQIFSK